MLRMRTTAAGLLLTTIALVIGGRTSPEHDTPGSTVVYIVRHAEKTGEDAQADLSDAGRARADVLTWMLRDVRLDAVYSTDFARTRHTVSAVAKTHGLTITPYAPRSSSFARQLLEGAGGTLLVCGHSDTIPKLLGELGTPIEDKILPGFDDLFVVLVTRGPDGAAHASLQRLHYPGTR